MDIDQHLENIDDDLQLLGSPPTPKSTAGTNDFVSRSSTINKSKNKSTRDDRLDNEDVDVGDAKKAKSEVWNYFEKIGKIDGVEKCKCKRCNKLYTCKSESGTTHLRRHFAMCYKTPKFHDVGSLLDNQATLLKKWKFDSKSYREALSRCIIQHDLPFSYAEYEGVIAVNKILNPEFKSISRNTAKADCMKVFLIEKEKLKSLLATLPGRFCLTSDCWTAVTTRGYMTVTAHYVDENWKLNTKLLSFCELDSPHSGYELSGKLFEAMKDWGIESRIFSLTLDNASSNDSMARILKERLNLGNDLLCKGEFFHVRCCAHILNIIVQEGLKAAEDALKRIRGSVKYVKASDGRLREFQKCVEEVHLSDVGGSFLRLDVSTRWNSTYMMLESAIKYRRAFSSLSYYDRNYKLCPTNEEWERAEKMCAFLAPFYHITNLISGSSYPTSNLYFMQIASIEMKLNELLTSEDEVIKDMASRMKVKFDKYWNEYCVTLAFGCILDPKAKLQFLNFCYRRLYPHDYEGKVHRVKGALYKLFGEYKQFGAATSSFPSSSSKEDNSHLMTSGKNSSSMTMTSILDEYHQEMRQMTSNEGKSELDIYLDEGCIVGNDIDVLEYWKVNKHRFPRLAIMACDILSIPITTVASESTFSIGGRILHKYRNCLLPETVQALICTRNWLHGFTEIEATDVQDVEEIRLSKEDSNVIDDDE